MPVEPVRQPPWEVREAIKIVKHSGVVDQIELWRAQEIERLGHHGGGRPETFPVAALLVAAVVAALHNEPLLATTFTDILFRRICPSLRRQLGVEWNDDETWDARYRRVRTRFHNFLEVIDPSPNPKNRRLPPEEFAAAVEARRAGAALTDAVLDERHDRLTRVVNALIEASLANLPKEVREAWTGSGAVDATGIQAFARAERRRRAKEKQDRTVLAHSADPDAAPYIRTTDEPGVQRESRETRVNEWAYEATLFVAGNDTPTLDHAFPNIVIAMAPLHRPGQNPGGNAIRALENARSRGYPAGWLAGDRAYSSQKPETFQLPARALGYKLIFDYKVDQLGIQTSHHGAIQIEGAWYCPAIPQTLIDATIDSRRPKDDPKRIDEPTWRTRIEARRPYRLRPKGRPDGEGHVRLLCPAAGSAPTGRCELKPRSFTLTDARTLKIDVSDAQTLEPPVVCRQQTATFPPEAGAKFAQALHYGSLEWADMYANHRNAVEGANGMLKDTAYGALADAGRRRIRGVAAQTIFTALTILATNVRAIRSFLVSARPDAEGTLRRPRKRRRTTEPLTTWTPAVPTVSGAPPGD